MIGRMQLKLLLSQQIVANKPRATNDSLPTLTDVKLLLFSVLLTNTHFNVVESLVGEMKNSLAMSKYDHVGSSSLWAKHYETVERMQNTLNNHTIVQVSMINRLKCNSMSVEYT